MSACYTTATPPKESWAEVEGVRLTNRQAWVLFQQMVRVDLCAAMCMYVDAVGIESAKNAIHLIEEGREDAERVKRMVGIK